jgi:hypothetical protein
MIEVLSSPIGKVNFTTVEGTSPQKAKYTKPVCKLDYCDTVFNTPQRGMDAHWLIENNNRFSTCFSGRVPILKFYCGEGVPETLMGYQTGHRWGVLYKSYFFPPITGAYTFYFGGSGNVYVDAGCFANSTSFALDIDHQAYTVLGPVSLTQGQVYPFNVRYYSNSVDDNAGLVALWKTASNPEKIVFSGSVFRAYSDSSLPGFSEISLFKNVSFRKSSDSNPTVAFDIPIISSTDSYNYRGYYYNHDDDTYVELETKNQLQKYRMVRYFAGYQNASGQNEYAQCFTGQIRDFSTKFSRDGQDWVTVTCDDYSVFTKDTINLMSPTPIDYWQVGYLTKTKNRFNGLVKPKAFDGWEIHKAYEVILTECGIDPYSFYKNKKCRSYSNTCTTAGFYIEPINFADKKYLSRRINYGIDPIGEMDENNVDDEYLYSISTGEFFQDSIDNIVKNWNYKWGFTPSAYPYLKTINVPYSIIGGEDFYTSAGWTTQINVNSIRGYYLQANNSNAVASCDVTGKKFTLTFGSGPSCGNFNVKLRKGSTLILDTNYSGYAAANHFYYDGADQSTGMNSSEFKFANGLPYDNYRAIIKNTSGYTRLNSILCYEEEYEVPSEYFYTGDNVESGSVLDLGVNSKIDDHRNSCIVLGRRTGTVVKINEKGEEQVLNRNNPIYTYVQSSSKDLNSLYVSSSINYVGRPRMTLITDPSINSQEQADFISFNVVKEYGYVKKEPDINIPGNPLIDIDDCVVVVDSYKDTITDEDYLWVDSFETVFDNTFTTKIKASQIKPVNSFWTRLAPDLSLYGNHYIYNLKILYSGYTGKLYRQSLYPNFYHPPGWAYELFVQKKYSTDICRTIIPSPGYCRIGPEVLKYDSADVTGGYIRLTGITEGIPRNEDKIYLLSSTSGFAGDDVIIGFLPYSNVSAPPTIDFDLLVDADVEVSVKNLTNGNNAEYEVDYLTNIDSKLAISDNYKYLNAGHYSFSWGGFDRLGNYNDSLKEEKFNMVGTQFYARENFSNSYGIPHGQGIHQYIYSTSHGLFYGQIRVNPKIDVGETVTYKTTSTETYIANAGGYGGNTNTIKQLLIDPGILDLTFSTATTDINLLHINPLYSFYYHLYGFECYYYTRDDRKTGSFLGDIQYDGDMGALKKSTNYPTVYRGHNTGVFVCNESNPDENGVAQGLVVKIKNHETCIDPDIKRVYLPTMQVYMVQFGRGQWEDQQNYWDPIQVEPEPISKYGINKITFNTNNEFVFYFNPQRYAVDKNVEFIPQAWLLEFCKQNNTNVTTNCAPMLISNLIFFDNKIVDFSGRKPKQLRGYTERYSADVDTLVPLDYNLDYYKNRGGYLYNRLYSENKEPFTYDSTDGVNGIPTIERKRSNRGFYQFPFDYYDQNVRAWDFYNYPSGIFQIATIRYPRTFHNEVQPYDDAESWRIFRNNYITWCDENQVREFIDFPDFVYGETGDIPPVTRSGIEIGVIRSYFNQRTPQLFVPNLWFRFLRKDFPEVIP